MQNMFHRAMIGLCLAALLISVNGHLLIVQGLGWSVMIVQYSLDSGSVAEGMVRTFGGREPCALCKTVLIALEQEPEKTVSPTLTPELRLFLPNDSVWHVAPRTLYKRLKVTDDSLLPNPVYAPLPLPS